MKRREFLKKSLGSVAFISLISNCGIKDPLKSDLIDYNYFPLNSGNKWNYKPPDTDVLFTIHVYPKIEYNGKEYFVVDWRLLRDVNGVVLNPINNSEQVYLDFNRKIGDRWQYIGAGEKWINHSLTPPIHNKYIIARHDVILFSDIYLTDCIQIVDEFDLGIAREWYAAGIGLVKREVELKNNYTAGGGYGSYTLHSAEIEGISVP